MDIKNKEIWKKIEESGTYTGSVTENKYASNCGRLHYSTAANFNYGYSYSNRTDTGGYITSS